MKDKFNFHKYDNGTKIDLSLKQNEKEMQNDDEIRLIGLRLDDLSVCNIRQISLFNNSLNDDSKLDKTIDKLKEKYGTNILFKAGSVKLKNKKE